MALDTFPTLPRTLEIYRETIYATKEYVSASGVKTKVSWWSTPQYRYSCTYRCRTTVSAPSPWQTDSEIGVVLHFYENQRGAFGSFNFVDPYDGQTRVVQFESDTLSIKQLYHGAWEVTFKLITVK